MVVEDGTGLSLADAMVDVEYADTYHAARGNSGWTALDVPKKEIALVLATDYFENVYGSRLLFPRLTKHQSLSMPTTEGMIETVRRCVAIIALESTRINLYRQAVADTDGNVTTREGAVTERSVQVDVIRETTRYGEPVKTDDSVTAEGILLIPAVESAMSRIVQTPRLRAHR